MMRKNLIQIQEKMRKHSNKISSGVVSKSPAPGRDLDQTNMENINQTYSISNANDNTPPDGSHAQFVSNGVKYIYEEILKNVDIRKQSKECPLFTFQERTSKGKTERNVTIQEHVNDAKPSPDLTTLFDGDKNTLETCKNPRPTSGWSELTKSCTTLTMAYFSCIPQNNARLKLSCKFGESKCNPC